MTLGARGGGCHQGEFAGAAGVGRGWGRAGGDPPLLELGRLFIVQFLSSYVGWYVEGMTDRIDKWDWACWPQVK